MTSFMTATREFFTLLPGQKAMDFGREVQKLTQEDRNEIAAGLIALGIEIDPATINKPA